LSSLTSLSRGALVSDSRTVSSLMPRKPRPRLPQFGSGMTRRYVPTLKSPIKLASTPQTHAESHIDLPGAYTPMYRGYGRVSLRARNGETYVIPKHAGNDRLIGLFVGPNGTGDGLGHTYVRVWTGRRFDRLISVLGRWRGCHSRCSLSLSRSLDC
jgi:hypothetical protein